MFCPSIFWYIHNHASLWLYLHLQEVTVLNILKICILVSWIASLVNCLLKTFFKLIFEGQCKLFLLSLFTCNCCYLLVEKSRRHLNSISKLIHHYTCRTAYRLYRLLKGTISSSIYVPCLIDLPHTSISLHSTPSTSYTASGLSYIICLVCEMLEIKT